MPAIVLALLPLLPSLVAALPSTIEAVRSLIGAIRADPGTPEEWQAILDTDQHDLEAIAAKVLAYRPKEG